MSEIKLHEPLAVEWKTSARGRRINLTVKLDGSVVVSVPQRMPRSFAERFVAEHADWIRKQVAKFSRYKNDTFLPRTRSEYLAHKEDARTLVSALLQRCNAAYGFHYNRVSIKNMSRNWGSCSKKRNLNFNYKLHFLPPELAEYVVVHELCHLGQLNHSKDFWALVAKTVPDHKNRRKELRRFHV